MFNRFLSLVSYELKLLLAQLGLVLLAMISRDSGAFFYFSSCRFIHKGHSKL